MSIKILRPSLDDFRDTTVLRGVIDRQSLGELRCDFYQREKLPESSRRDILCGLAAGAPLPDIEIGMRGDHFSIVQGDDDRLVQAVVLEDPCFIIDGRQRVDTLKEYVYDYPETKASLGATVHFNTNADWERARFHTLNTSRVKVAPSVLLRNIKDDSPGLATLYGLSRAQADFVLYRRICWAQNQARSELMTGLSYVRTVLRCHAHLAPTRSGLTATNIPSIIDRVVERVGMPLWRQNAVTFWALIDELWGIKGLNSKGAPYLMSQFLSVFADILSDHVDFWRQPEEMRLFMPDELKRKLKKFPVGDPEVVRLAGASGKAREALYFIIVSHINSGKRTKRLVPRNVRATIPPLNGDDEEEPDEEEAA